MESVKDKLKALGIVLPPPPAPAGAYVPYVQAGNLVFVSGQLPRSGDVLVKGKVGAEVNLQTAKQAARTAGINGLAVLDSAVGLDRVKRIVKLMVIVSCVPSFTDQPQVANGASDLMLEVFGEQGRHARMAASAPALPLDACVEVEMIAEVKAPDER